MLTLIENGEVYAPAPSGKISILLAGDKILKVGEINRRAVESLGVELDVINARNCIVATGLIDPHEHLLGGSGEKGFATQTPEIYASELVQAGITTVVGCLGVDTTMKTMAGLLAKAKGLKEEGLNAFLWSGGYKVPPATITDSICDDIMFVEEVIGAGEIAISDKRSTAPEARELARIVSDAYVGGILSKKAGLTHFHVGEDEKRLQILRDLIEKYDVSAEWLYPTHITRSEELMLEAIELAKQRSFVDIDTVDEDLPERLKFYLDNGGLPEKLTVSSDASVKSPQTLFEQLRLCVVEHKFPFEQIFRLATENTARALKLEQKGTLKEGNSADILILEKHSLELRDVISSGRRLLKNGSLAFKEKFLEESTRDVKLKGEKMLKKAKSKK